MADEIWEKLCSSAKLERDRGYEELEKRISDEDENLLKLFQSSSLSLFAEEGTSWEKKHGALSGMKALLLSERNLDEDFMRSATDASLQALTDEEFRVRIAAGEVLGALCKRKGPEVYECAKDAILEGIRSNLERQPVDDTEHEQLVEKLAASSSPPVSPGGMRRRGSAEASQIFHDTAGWKNLETWMKCLQCVTGALGFKFNPYVSQELLSVIFQALDHTNRFVRETGYYVCASLVGCSARDSDTTADMASCEETNAILREGHRFAEYLGKGLSDNWSQVRLAGSVATRVFLTSLPSESHREKYYPILIPRMCLNRYYVAEGVRIYSQDTWRLVTQGAGKCLVERYIENVVNYYIEQADADNHAVREAACACIAELGSKIDKKAVSPFIPRLLKTLLICFNDDSWPVRDAACVACGNFILCFPDESKDSLPALYPLFFNNLQDNIASVRQGAAVALANVARAYGEETHEKILSKMKEAFENLKNQPETAERYSGLDKGPATYGVVKKLRDNDMDLHTDKQMYSCGSLAPKMGKGSRAGGCMDHKFRKPSEPWELADGSAYLVAELSQVPSMATKVAAMLPALATACNLRHYTQHVVFLETICKQLVLIGKSLGKRLFKMHLELFFEPIFYALYCDNALTSTAASQCLGQLSTFLGHGILRGRIEQFNPGYLQPFDEVVPPV